MTVSVNAIKGRSRLDLEEAVLGALPEPGQSIDSAQLAIKSGVEQEVLQAILRDFAWCGLVKLANSGAVHVNPRLGPDQFSYVESEEMRPIPGRNLLAGQGFDPFECYCSQIRRNHQTVPDLYIYQPGRPLRVIIDGRSIRPAR